MLNTWDPYNAVILAEFDGTVQFDAITEGITFREESDEQTGHREKVIIESKAKDQNPSIIIRPPAKRAMPKARRLTASRWART